MSTTTLTPDEWVTREDMAILARCSTDTITRDLKNPKYLMTRDRTDEAGRVLCQVGEFLRIGRIRPEDLTTGATPAESAEVLRARETITGLKTQVAELTGSLAQADMVRDTLRDQLAVKDKQIAQQASQLTGLIARLGVYGGAA